jgi:hypothetical protein
MACARADVGRATRSSSTQTTVYNKDSSTPQAYRLPAPVLGRPSFRTPQGPPLRFANTRAGVGRLLERIAALPTPVTVALEATGPYWLALHDALVAAGLAVRVLNPLQTQAYRRTAIRKAKTDRRDAWLIADLVRVGRARAAYVPDDAVVRLRELTRFRWGLVDRLGDAKRQRLAVLDRIFSEHPGRFSDPLVRGARALLREAASAARGAGPRPRPGGHPGRAARARGRWLRRRPGPGGDRRQELPALKSAGRRRRDAGRPQPRAPGTAGAARSGAAGSSLTASGPAGAGNRLRRCATAPRRWRRRAASAESASPSSR